MTRHVVAERTWTNEQLVALGPVAFRVTSMGFEKEVTRRIGAAAGLGFECLRDPATGDVTIRASVPEFAALPHDERVVA